MCFIYNALWGQATELCGEKAANLQTTLIHLQWQSKHVEQRLMADRAAREFAETAVEVGAANLSRAGAASTATVEVAAPSAVNNGACLGTRSHTSGVGTTTALAPPPSAGGDKRPGSLPRAGSDRLEVLQLTAKGQALARAVVVVESVLQKMEEQARNLAG